MALSFTLTPNTANAYMSVTVSGLLATEDTLLVTRNNPDGSIGVCRNANSISTGGVTTFNFFDYEAPLNSAVTYNATSTKHNIDGSLTQQNATSGPGTIVFTDQAIWLKSLSQPSLSMEVEIASMEPVARNARVQINPIIGAKFPVVLSDVQGARTGAMVLRTYDLPSRLAMITLLDLGQPIFMQCDSAAIGGDGFEDMYFQIGNFTEGRPQVRSTDTVREWNIIFTEVDSPSGTLTSLAGNSWLLVSTAFASWNDLLTHRTTWLDVLNRPAGS